jgi:hypothetical protein
VLTYSKTLEESEPAFYMVDAFLTFSEYWQDKDTVGTNSSNRLTTVYHSRSGGLLKAVN